MKRLILCFLFGGLLATTSPLLAQTSAPEPIEYSERVPSEGAGRTELYRRALDWTENHFAYGPKTGIKADAGTSSIRLTGTAKMKVAQGNAPASERTLRFDFVFQSTDNGYVYSVGSFRIIPDPKKVEESMPLDEFVTQLAAEKGNDRTHNDRRTTAMANSLASEIALGFRSYMNSMPSSQEAAVGLNAAGEN
ncbi:DUF4468 domain-containing protein [Hymenobacter jejuensis]|uniref:DUF4468 domain-containing protein n=1 Tax=Hymenobacter jejuensis TaxID=2502781 RepID=A0A5B8A045_9BACT|nr:DUF4468 domain-containing protein [Hymenobacter jejuensis]QDA60507.1 DUF4468 domain-containing protein [Hymenobacter jejuensis]